MLWHRLLPVKTKVKPKGEILGKLRYNYSLGKDGNTGQVDLPAVLVLGHLGGSVVQPFLLPPAKLAKTYF